tara:strand:+ start:60 stop:536 length:477 start_codon:yes stop_codon:yes gene_type:complete
MGSRSNGSTNGVSLLHCIEASFSAIPKTIRKTYEREELVSSTWLILKSRGAKRPTKVQIKFAAIDFHRTNTHYRKGKKHGDQFTNSGESLNEEILPDKTQDKSEVVEHFHDLRRRFGTDGFIIFLLSRVLEFSRRDINQIMDFEPDSALSRSFGELGK